jgi:hypothetical protein
VTLWANPDGTIVIPPLGDAVLPIGCTAFDWTDADTPTLDAVLANPSRYAYQGGQVVALPYFTLATAISTTTTPPTVTVTATLNSPPATPPASATFTIAGKQITAVLGGSPLTATLQVQVHPSVAGGSIPVTVSAQGCVGASIDLGTPGVPNDVLQLVGTAQPYLVAPTHKAWVRQWAFGALAEDPMAQIVTALQDLYTATSLLLQIVVSKVLPTITAASYSPLALSQAEQQSLSSLQTNVLPNALATLENLTTLAIYDELVSQSPAYAQAAQAYQQALAAVPNLS